MKIVPDWESDTNLFLLPGCRGRTTEELVRMSGTLFNQRPDDRRVCNLTTPAFYIAIG